MEDLPRTTLTQRRTEVLSGSKKLTKSKLEHDEPSYAPTSGEKPAVGKIVVWIVVIVLIGIGSAILVTNLLNNQSTNTKTLVPESSPVSTPVTPIAEEPDTEPEDETPVVDPDPEPAQPTTPAPTQPSGPVGGTIDGLTIVDSLSDYSQQPRILNSEVTANNTILNKVRYYETVTEFNYLLSDLKTSSGQLAPKIALFYEGNDVVLEIRNVSRDNVIGEESSVTNTYNGVVAISSLEASNEGNISRFQFKMSKKVAARVNLDLEKRELLLQIDNR